MEQNRIEVTGRTGMGIGITLIDRPTDRQTGIQTDRQTVRQTDR